MGRREEPEAAAAGGQYGEAEQALAQLSQEAAAISSVGKADSDTINQRNELLWKITAQIDEAKLNLQQLEDTQKRLKKHLAQLDSLRKILSK